MNKAPAEPLDPKQCPKYLPADNPARINRDSTIIDMAATGKPQSHIAAALGIDKSRVCQILSDDEAKAKLQLIINKHIAASGDIQDNLISIAKTTPGANDKIRTSDILTATKEHNQIIGISGTHTQGNVFIGKYYQQNNIAAVDPGVVDVLRDLVKRVADNAPEFT